MEGIEADIQSKSIERVAEPEPAQVQTKSIEKPKKPRTEAQKASLIKILKVLKNIYPKASIHAHRDYSPDKDGDGVEEHEFMKQCPCFSAEEEYLDLQTKSFKPKTKKVKEKLNGKKSN